MANKKLTKSLMQIFLTTAILGLGTTYTDENGEKKAAEPRPLPKGREPKQRTEEEKAIHKAHQKKIKARRNAKKGIYECKITYKKHRK